MNTNLGKQYNAIVEAEATKNVERVLTIEELKQEAESVANEATVALTDNKVADYTLAMTRLGAVIEEYTDLAQRKAFACFRDADNPKLEAAKARYFGTIAAKVVNDPKTKLPQRVEIIEKDRMIDLLKFCDFAGLPTMWWTSVAAYCQWLALQVSDSIGMSEGYKLRLIEKFKVSDDAKKLDPSRFSKTEKVKTLQSIIDEMVFVDGKTEGKNALRVNNHDIEYLTITTSNPTQA